MSKCTIRCNSCLLFKKILLPTPAGAPADTNLNLKRQNMDFTGCMDTSGSNFISQKQRMVLTFSRVGNNASLVRFRLLAHCWTDFSLAILPVGNTWLPAAVSFSTLSGLVKLSHVFLLAGCFIWAETSKKKKKKSKGCCIVSQKIAW